MALMCGKRLKNKRLKYVKMTYVVGNDLSI